MAKQNIKSTKQKNENDIIIHSENENKTLTVNREDFEREAEYFHNTGNTSWDWKEVED
jgi:hypothetical protein